jgi:hypothetical protein
MDDFEDEDPPPILNTGSVYDLVGKPRRGKKQRAIGFVLFPDRERKKPPKQPIAKKPTRRTRRK